MKYDFPLIRSIDDIERHRSAGLIHEAFKRGQRQNGTIVYDYAYMDNHVFPAIGTSAFASLARELRGLTFDAGTGVLLSRPFQKFFNAGEREEVLAQHIPFADPHHVLAKLDGSMIHAFIAPDGALTFATRWGETTISREALAWYAGRDTGGRGQSAIRQLVEDGFTPIFEWTSPGNIVVVRHERPELTLTGVRERESGAYVPYDALGGHAAAAGVPLVSASDTIAHWDSFVQRAVAETEGEGYVVRFADGHMLKVKNATYSRVHKFKARLSRERDAAEIVISGALDDMLPHLTPGEREQFEAYQSRMLTRLADHATRIDGIVAQARAEITVEEPRERQKLFWTTYAQPLGAPFSSILTEVWIGRRQAWEGVADSVLRQMGTEARFEAAVKQFDLPRFSFGFDDDA